ncbi:M48 family metalloprotease [Alsobacter metallidurans]|uniref:M48 family metalloprotease n=1 Tax=Alsobacter metallidurans TaxID=340221 RepID=UPI0016644863|nr:M48 family metalloprotease [Alsobacter metallidurans]
MLRCVRRSPSSNRPAPPSGGLRRGVVSLAVAAAMAFQPIAASAQQARAGVIRDAEVEALLRDYATPVFGAAGIRKGSVQIVLIGDRSFNAFVADGRRMFVNVGAIMDAKTPNEMIGVIAHESGHIAGGHLQRLREQLANAQILAIVGMLLGVGGAAAGMASRDRVGNAGGGAMGIALGSQELVKRSLLAYQRSEEQAADLMALRFLQAIRQSPKGMLDTFQRFNQDAMFKTASVDPYLVSHPMPNERIANLERLAAKSPFLDVKDPPALQFRHDMARAKLFGFTAKAEEVGRRYPPSDMTRPARYARAIIAYRYKRLPEALSQVDALIREDSGNPYLWELKGQVLLEFGRAAEAIPLLRKAVSLAPSAGPIRTLLGQALVATESKAGAAEAVRELSNAVQREPEWAEGWHHLSRAYGLKGDEGMAAYAAAQAYFYSGDYNAAATQATRAKEKLPPNSPGWIKADDLLNTRPPQTP